MSTKNTTLALYHVAPGSYTGFYSVTSPHRSRCLNKPEAALVPLEPDNERYSHAATVICDKCGTQVEYRHYTLAALAAEQAIVDERYWRDRRRTMVITLMLSLGLSMFFMTPMIQQSTLPIWANLGIVAGVLLGSVLLVPLAMLAFPRRPQTVSPHVVLSAPDASGGVSHEVVPV